MAGPRALVCLNRFWELWSNREKNRRFLPKRDAVETEVFKNIFDFFLDEFGALSCRFDCRSDAQRWDVA